MIARRLPACRSAPCRRQWCTQLAQGVAQCIAPASISCRSSSTSVRKPRVVLIGWLGAQQRHFDKCAAVLGPAAFQHCMSQATPD